MYLIILGQIKYSVLNLYFYLFFQAGIPDPPNMSEDLIKIKAKERHFLEQLLDGKKLENYKIPVPIKAELRKYQQVSFHLLNKFSFVKQFLSSIFLRSFIIKLLEIGKMK